MNTVFCLIGGVVGAAVLASYGVPPIIGIPVVALAGVGLMAWVGDEKAKRQARRAQEEPLELDEDDPPAKKPTLREKVTDAAKQKAKEWAMGQLKKRF